MRAFQDARGPARRRHLRRADLGRAGRGGVAARRPAALLAAPDAARRRRRRAADAGSTRLGFDAGRVDGIFGPTTARGARRLPAQLRPHRRRHLRARDRRARSTGSAGADRRRLGRGRRSASASAAPGSPPRSPAAASWSASSAASSALAAHGRPRAAPGAGRGRRRVDEPDPSAQAAAANRLRGRRLPRPRAPRPSRGCRCSLLRRADFESAGGRRAGRAARASSCSTASTLAPTSRGHAPARCCARRGCRRCSCELGPVATWPSIAAPTLVARRRPRRRRRLGRAAPSTLASSASRRLSTGSVHRLCVTLDVSCRSRLDQTCAERPARRRCGQASTSVERSVIAPVDPLEVLEVGELDRRPCPAWRPSCTADPGVEVVAEQLLELEQPGRPQPGGRRRPAAVGRPRRRGSAPSASAAARSRTASSTVAHRQALGDDPAGQLLLERAVGGAEQGPGVARRRAGRRPPGAGSPAAAGAAAGCW